MVFVTAHDGFALRAFEESAADYLLKPVARERLAKTVEKLARRTAPAPRPAVPAPPLTRVPCLAGKATSSSRSPTWTTSARARRACTS